MTAWLIVPWGRGTLIWSWNRRGNPNDCMVNCSWGRGASISSWNPTSSAAQGGGGSFKKRSPVGEVRCCDARMAERTHWWTERWLELCFLEWSMVAVITSPQLLDVVVCSAVIVVVASTQKEFAGSIEEANCAVNWKTAENHRWRRMALHTEKTSRQCPKLVSKR